MRPFGKSGAVFRQKWSGLSTKVERPFGMICVGALLFLVVVLRFYLVMVVVFRCDVCRFSLLCLCCSDYCCTFACRCLVLVFLLVGIGCCYEFLIFLLWRMSFAL